MSQTIKIPKDINGYKLIITNTGKPTLEFGIAESETDYDKLPEIVINLDVWYGIQKRSK